MNGQQVPAEKVDKILEAARLAPTSSGLQPFKVLVITDQALKEKIFPIAFSQQQIIDCSHLLVFAAWDNYTVERINEVFARTNAERGLPESATDDYRKRLIDLYTPRPAEENFVHAAKQSYIAFGLAIAEAAIQEVDATPMEGFDASALDELLNLKEQGLRSTTILPLGFRDPAGDWLHGLKKVRTPLDEFVINYN